VWELIEKHIQWHRVIAESNAEQAAQLQAQAMASQQEIQGAQQQDAAEAEHARALEMQAAKEGGDGGQAQ
jgi:hypothetical protein